MAALLGKREELLKEYRGNENIHSMETEQDAEDHPCIRTEEVQSPASAEICTMNTQKRKPADILQYQKKHSYKSSSISRKAVEIEQLQEELSQMRNSIATFKLKDNTMNAMFSVLQKECTGFTFWSSFAISARTVAKRISETDDDVLIPLHVLNTHWILLHYSVCDGQWYSFDSLGLVGRNSFSEASERLHKHSPSYVLKGKAFDHQEDAVSCGVFVLAYAFLVSKGMCHRLEQLNFTAAVPLLRKAIVQDISQYIKLQASNEFETQMMRFIDSADSIRKDVARTISFSNDDQRENSIGISNFDANLYVYDAKKITGEKSYEVEAILDKKEWDGEDHFLIHFAGYSTSEDEWIPRSQLNATLLIEEFDRKYSRKLRQMKAKKIFD